MTMTDPNDKMLDDLFAQVRGVAPVPSDALVARVLAEAKPPQAASAPQAKPGFWERFSDMIGGWPAVSGLAAAVVAGIWVGVAPPSSVEDATAAFWGDEVSVSLFSDDLVFDAGELVDG
jgi:hypothetical protein